MKKVSIGLPFLNSARTLVTAVRSIFAQSLQDWELILVDDGSSDESLKLARQIKDHRVRVVSDGVNRGLSCRLNQIAVLAQYEYLARMDADDIMHPCRLEHQLAHLTANPSIEVLGSLVYVMDAHGDVFGIRGQLARLPNLRSVIAHGLFIHPTVIGRRAWFLANPYDTAFPRGEDHELWIRTLSSSKFAVLDEPLLFYRDAVGARGKYNASCRNERKILRKYGLPALGRSETALAIAKTYAKSAIYCISTAVHLEQRVLARRNRSLAKGDRQSAGSALAAVRQIRIPGLD